MTVLSKNPRCQECGLPIFPGVDHYCGPSRSEQSRGAIVVVAILLIVFWLVVGRCSL